MRTVLLPIPYSLLVAPHSMSSASYTHINWSLIKTDNFFYRCLVLEKKINTAVDALIVH